jgi:hypothetical protein
VKLQGRKKQKSVIGAATPMIGMPPITKEA